MPYKHGIEVTERPTSLTPPVETSAGIQVIFGTAPVNMTEDPAINKPVVAYSFNEAKELLGYSDNWGHYTLCESMDASFRRLNVAPLIFINVLDPKVHKEDVEGYEIDLANKEAKIEIEGVLLDTLVIMAGETELQRDQDYFANFDDEGYVQIEIDDEANVPSELEKLITSFTKLDPSEVTKDDIVGGYDTVEDLKKGLEVISDVYPRLGLVPGIITAPGWSHIPEVASVIDAKSTKINGVFSAVNYLDIDSTEVTKYQDAREWKNNNSYTSPQSYLVWPKAKIGEREYFLSSLLAAVTARTDSENEDVPYVSPSNKRIPITGLVADGREIYLDQEQANMLNGNGINTCININGWRTWGNNTAAYPGTTDPKDRFLAIRRVFNWWGNTFILSYFENVDDPTNTRLIENIVDSENIRGNGFQARGQIAGAKIEFREEMNPLTNLLDGSIKFIQKIAAFPPAKHIVNELEYDTSLLQESLFGGE